MGCYLVNLEQGMCYLSIIEKKSLQNTVNILSVSSWHELRNFSNLLLEFLLLVVGSSIISGQASSLASSCPVYSDDLFLTLSEF